MTQATSISLDDPRPGRPALDESTRRRIVTEARQRFFSLGIRRVTMDDLAYDLGMSKRTLYQHFRTKTALVEAVFRDKFQSVEHDLAEITAISSSNCLEAIPRLLACIQRHMEELQPPLVQDIRREAPSIFTLVEGHRRDMIDRHLGKVLREGCKAGIIRKDVPIDLIMGITLASVQAIMNPERLSELGLTPKEGFMAILTVIFQGAMTQGGRPKP
jgi:AcrR family transcriptional regulator